MDPMQPTPRTVLAAVAIAIAAVLPAPRAGAITPEEMNPHRQTLAEIDAVGVAVAGWLTDQVSLGAPRAPLGSSIDVADYPVVTHAALEALLVPDYIAAVPELDGWGNPYDYRLDTADPLGPNPVLIRSAGEDGVFDGTVYSPGEIFALAEDLVWADGFLARRPGPPLVDYRTRQENNMPEVGRIGVAMLSWVTDQVSVAPRAGSPDDGLGGTVDLSLFTPITASSLEALLVPGYLLFLPATDPWGESFDFYLDTGDLLGPELAAVRSRGFGGVAEGDVYTPGTFDAVMFSGDVVWADGVFVRTADLSKLIFYDDFETGDYRFWSASGVGF